MMHKFNGRFWRRVAATLVILVGAQLGGWLLGTVGFWTFLSIAALAFGASEAAW